MRIRIVASAHQDLEEGFHFYEKQEEGTGDYFIKSIRADIEELHITGGVHPVKYKDYHRLVCHVFPFAVYYTKDENEVVIYAVVDCRSDPDAIRQHLGEIR